MLKNLYLIVGPSGVGKTSLIEALKQEYGYRDILSYTDRAPRTPDEGSHLFVSEEEFNKLVGEMVAYTKFNGHRYGTTAGQVESCDLYAIDPFGITFMKNVYTGNRPFKVIGLALSEDKREDRMLARGDSCDAARERILHDRDAFAEMVDFCDVVLQADKPIPVLRELAHAVIMEFERL